MQIENPHKPGTVCHQHFASFVTWYKDKSSEYLVEKHASLVEDSRDYMRNSSNSMDNSQFQAECISLIHEARFGTPLQEKTQ